MVVDGSLSLCIAFCCVNTPQFIYPSDTDGIMAVSSLWVFSCMTLGERTHTFLWGRYLRVDWLCRRVVRCLALAKTASFPRQLYQSILLPAACESLVIYFFFKSLSDFLWLYPERGSHSFKCFPPLFSWIRRHPLNSNRGWLWLLNGHCTHIILVPHSLLFGLHDSSSITSSNLYLGWARYPSFLLSPHSVLPALPIPMAHL